jgi:GNAT superfamily N-acetyltransferase
MKDTTREIVESFWTHDLGLDADPPGQPEIRCSVQHLYNGVQMLRRANHLVVAVPAALRDRIQGSMQGRSIDELFSADWLRSALGEHAVRILGPAEVQYADETTFRPPDTLGARKLLQEDLAACRLLRAALNDKEAEESGFSADITPSFGAFEGSTICAAANYSVWEPSIAHITVATHPEYRRRGFAKAAIGALAEEALNRGLILQWRAVAWNSNSLALARDLGFEHYCSTLFARLRT